ncbi:dihydrofolate reductase family protein [Roseateles toxinivorans]|uniref:dihydrofolate reductase family protein n=1 Tax=Roseateles toxinivorans TaxID=270368 RepID=UPI001FB8185F|nr:dihydrofolate reductase family protein [Roseateles toxinivorans]
MNSGPLSARTAAGSPLNRAAWSGDRVSAHRHRQRAPRRVSRTEETLGLLTFSINVTLDGCVDHQQGIADDETHTFFTRLMDDGGAMLWGRVTYEMMESYWPAVARGDAEAPPAMREWAIKLEGKQKYVVSSTRSDFPWANSHHIAGDLRTGVQKLKDATPDGVLLGSGKLATELDRLDLIDEYKLLVHPRIAGRGPTLYESGLPITRRLELISAKPLRNGAVAMHYRRAR